MKTLAHNATLKRGNVVFNIEVIGFDDPIRFIGYFTLGFWNQLTNTDSNAVYTITYRDTGNTIEVVYLKTIREDEPKNNRTFCKVEMGRI